MPRDDHRAPGSPPLRALLRHALLRRLGRRLRRDGHLRQARLRRGRDGRDAAGRPLRARGRAVLGAARRALARLRALPRRDLGRRPRPRRVRLRAAGRSATSPRSSASTRSLLSLLLYTFPAMVAIAAVALGRERIDRRRVAALVLASAGWCSSLAGAGAGALEPLGVVLGMGAAWSTRLHPRQRRDRRARPADRARRARVHRRGGDADDRLGALGQLRPGALTAAGWGWLGCIAVVSTVVAMSLFFAGLRRAGPTTASILATVEPLVTVLLAFVVFGESLAAIQLARRRARARRRGARHTRRAIASAPCGGRCRHTAVIPARWRVHAPAGRNR